MTDNDTPRRRKLSKLAKRLLWAAVPISVLLGFAIWVHGKTAFTPDFLGKHGFRLIYGVGGDYDEEYYEAEVPVASVVVEFENEMSNRGFDVDRTDFGDYSQVEVSNGGIMLGYLEGNGQVVGFHLYPIHPIPHRIQLATGWRILP